MRDGVSLNQQRQVRPVVRGSDIMLLQDLEAYIKYPGKFPVSKVKFEYLHFTRSNESFKPQPNYKLKEDSSEVISKSEPTEVIETNADASNVIHPNFKKTKNQQKSIIPQKKDEELTFDL
jgi:type IV secretory pathway TraG/TraD family ATPase VirD4